MATAFHGDPPTELHEVNHIDGDKTNNNASNLQWVTRKENHAHAMRTGLMQRVKHRKLSDDDVRAIRAMGAVRPLEHIGALFGVTGQNIKYVLEGKTWKDVV